MAIGIGDRERDAVLLVDWVGGSLGSGTGVGSLRLRLVMRLERRREERRES